MKSTLDRVRVHTGPPSSLHAIAVLAAAGHDVRSPAGCRSRPSTSRPGRPVALGSIAEPHIVQNLRVPRGVAQRVLDAAVGLGPDGAEGRVALADDPCTRAVVIESARARGPGCRIINPSPVAPLKPPTRQPVLRSAGRREGSRLCRRHPPQAELSSLHATWVNALQPPV